MASPAWQATADSSVVERLAQVEALFEVLPVGIAIAYDTECRAMRANAYFNEMLGITAQDNPSKTAERASDLPFRVFRDGVEVAGANLPMQVSAREGVAIDGSRCEIRRADGKTLVMCGTVRPVLGPDGEPRGSVGAFLDITEREALLAGLQQAQSQIRVLRGLLRICANCKKIHEGEDSWRQMEAYIREHSEADFSHGLCPDCGRHAMEQAELA